MKTGVLNIPAPVWMTPCPPRLQLQTLWIGVILTGKMTFWGDPLSSQILFNKSDNTKQTNNKTSHSNSIEELDIEVKTNLLNILKFNSTPLFWLEAIQS